MADFKKVRRQARQIATENYYGARERYGRFSGTGFGKAINQGIRESFGFYYEDGVSQGFLGLGHNNIVGNTYDKVFNRRLQQGATAVSARMGGAKAVARSLPTLARRAGWSGSLGAVGKSALKGMGGIFTAYSVYTGYQENGALGAVQGFGESIGMNIAWSVGAKVLHGALGGLAIGTALGVGAGYGLYKYGKAAGDYGRRTRNLEMGGTFVDTFGTAATMRQRSLSALQNTHLNGRLALGNEASLMHSPMMR